MNNSILIDVFKHGKIVQSVTPKNLCIIFGRSRNVDIQLNGMTIGQQHARLEYLNGRWTVQDLSSMTGTFVNEDRIIEYSGLSETDIIRIQQYEIRIRFKAQSDIPTVVPVTPTMTHVAEQVHPSQDIHYPSSQAKTSMDQFNQWRSELLHEVVSTFDLRRDKINELSSSQLRQHTRTVAAECIEQWNAPLSAVQQSQLIQAIIDDIVGLGPLEPLLRDESITEIMVNSPQTIFVERKGNIEKSSARFPDDQAMIAVIDRIVSPLGRRIDQSSPMVDARLPDGSRVNAIIPPLAINGPCITIRKFPSKRLVIDDLVGFGSMNQAMADFFKVAVCSGKNIVVSGGTGTGKTTLLNVLSSLIPHRERIITIEDAAELQLDQPDLVALEAKPANMEGQGAITIRDLVKNALRMRPNRIVIGECRGAEALDMMQAMNTGHDGSLTTIHANTPRDGLSRLEVMIMMAGMDIPIQAIREQISSAIHIIVQQCRFPCGARKITHVTEVVGMEAGMIQLQDIFLFQRQGFTENGHIQGEFLTTGFIPSFYEELKNNGINLDTSIFTGRSLEAMQ